MGLSLGARRRSIPIAAGGYAEDHAAPSAIRQLERASNRITYQNNTSKAP
jgi:hypothetical protein